MLNELRVGLNRSRLFFRPIDEGINHVVQAGIRGGFEESSAAYPSFPDILITGYADMQGAGAGPAAQAQPHPATTS